MTFLIKNLLSLLILASILNAQEDNIIKGIDISSLQQIEDSNGKFYENGTEKDPLEIFKENGINTVRLRLWHNPQSGYNNFSKTLMFTQRIKNMGLKFILDFHYSDSWADPSQQVKPNKWKELTFHELKDSIYSYTKFVVSTLKKQNTIPEIIQIGNEITCGFLWDDGRICDSFNNEEQWNKFSDLIKEGIRGVKESLTNEDSVKIMLHIDNGGSSEICRWFLDNLNQTEINYDIIGLSYYPWWHGTLDVLKYNINDLLLRYDKEIIVTETAYPWTLNWNDNTQNIIGNSNQLLNGYPASVEGQKKYIEDLLKITTNQNNKLLGLVYWEPAWISTQSFGSPWENLALFDFNGEVLNSIKAFNNNTVKVNTDDRFVFELNQNYPNPFNPVTIIEYSLPRKMFVILKIYDLLGNELSTLVNETKESGTYEIKFDASDLPSGVYFYSLNIDGFFQVKKMILTK